VGNLWLTIRRKSNVLPPAPRRLIGGRFALSGNDKISNRVQFFRFRETVLFLKFLPVDLEARALEGLDLRSSGFDGYDRIGIPVRDEESLLPADGRGVVDQILQFEDLAANADQTGETTGESGADIERHQAALRESEQKHLLDRVAFLNVRFDQFEQRFTAADDARFLVAVIVVPGKSREVRVRGIDEHVVHIRQGQSGREPGIAPGAVAESVKDEGQLFGVGVFGGEEKSVKHRGELNHSEACGAKSFCNRRPGLHVATFVPTAIVPIQNMSAFSNIPRFCPLARALGAALALPAAMATLACAADAPDAATKATANDRATVIVVVGAAGNDEYGESFKTWAGHWAAASKKAEARSLTIGLDESKEGEPTDKERLKAALEKEPKQGGNELWIVLLGHGTYDRRSAKFNLRGDDMTSSDLGRWLADFRRPVAVINTASASSPFINRLAGADRVVISATKSGDEINFARFGQFISEAIGGTKADLDKDGQTSLLEAYLMGSRRTEEWYESEGRLATEHALLDDNGDGKGTPAGWFRGARAVKKAKDGTSLDGHRAHQFHLVRSEQERRMPPELRQRRDTLEMAVIRHREKKVKMSEDAYYEALETLLLKLARLYEEESGRVKPASTPNATP
jgi:hypothetical protein